MLSNEEMDKQAEEALEESRKERERQEEEIRLLQEKRVSFTLLVMLRLRIIHM